MKKLRVTVEGKVYEVLAEMLDEQPGIVPQPAVVPRAPMAAPSAPSQPIAAPAPAAPVAGKGSVVSPLSGKILSIDVKIGDAVAENAQLVTLEAMKMNTYVFAPHAGSITAIHVAAGDGVEEGAPLLTLG